MPSFHIIKCSTAKDEPDLTRTRVIQNLHTQPGFTAADGYTLSVWEKQMTLTKQVRKQPVQYSITFRRPYLQHKDKLTLITCQHRAWMDTGGVAMWAELLMGPYLQKKCGGKRAW